MTHIEPREVADSKGKPTGRFRLTSRSDDDASLAIPAALCLCPGGHESREAACKCPIARKNAARVF